LNTATFNPQNSQFLTAFHPEQLSKVLVGDSWRTALGENVFLNFEEANSHKFSLDYAVRYASANNEQSTHALAKYGKRKWKALTAITFSKFGDWRSGKNTNNSDSFEWRQETETSQVNGTDLLTPTKKPYLQNSNNFNSLFLTQKISYEASKSKHELIFNYARFSELNDYGRLREDSLGRFSNTNLRFAEFENPSQSRLLLAYKTAIRFWESELSVQINYQNTSEGRNYRLFRSETRHSFEENMNAFGGQLAWSKDLNGLNISISNRASYNQVNASASNENFLVNDRSILRTRYADESSTFSNLLTTDFRYNFERDWDLYGYFQVHNSSVKTATPIFGDLVDIGQFEQSYSAPTWGLQVEKYLSFINFASVNIQTKFNSSFRAPNLYELASIQLLPAGNHLLVPKLELQPEKAYNFEFSTDFHWGNFALNTRYFHNWIDDLIQLRVTTDNLLTIDEFENQNLVTFSHANISKSETYGFSIKTDYVINDIHTTLSAGVTYTKGNIQSEGNQSLAGIAPIAGLVSIDYRHNSLKMRHQLSLQMNGEKALSEFATNSSDQRNYFLDSDGAPSWYTIDYRAEWEISRKIQLQFAVENILDTHYRTFGSSLNGLGRNFVVTVRGNL
jgi:hemoglobin/transferrin/lactoferrin receptor protein